MTADAVFACVFFVLFALSLGVIGYLAYQLEQKNALLDFKNRALQRASDDFGVLRDDLKFIEHNTGQVCKHLDGLPEEIGRMEDENRRLQRQLRDREGRVRLLQRTVDDLLRD